MKQAIDTIAISLSILCLCSCNSFTRSKSVDPAACGIDLSKISGVKINKKAYKYEIKLNGRPLNYKGLPHEAIIRGQASISGIFMNTSVGIDGLGCANTEICLNDDNQGLSLFIPYNGKIYQNTVMPTYLIRCIDNKESGLDALALAFGGNGEKITWKIYSKSSLPQAKFRNIRTYLLSRLSGE